MLEELIGDWRNDPQTCPTSDELGAFSYGFIDAYTQRLGLDETASFALMVATTEEIFSGAEKSLIQSNLLNYPLTHVRASSAGRAMAFTAMARPAERA